MNKLNIYKDHKIKNPKQLEKYFKGIANHRRIEILLLVKNKPSLSLDNITEILDANYKTISGHMTRLIYSGLISRNQNGEKAKFSITPYGKLFCKFIDDFILS